MALLKGCSILGVRAGEAMRRDPQLAARSARELAALTAAGHLRPRISLALPLAQAADALELLETRLAVGRIALIADPALR
ncbi:MAG: zinc-binding dehydrogenase [Steroidobacteraceae bacterium]